MSLLENLENKIDNIIDFSKNSLENLQKNFLESNLYDVVNDGLDSGIKYICPDFIEDEVISLKDTIIENGVEEGIKKAVNSIYNIGKNIVSITTNDYDSINQIEDIVEEGGTMDILSKYLDKGIDIGNKSGLINDSLKEKLIDGKNVIIENISNNLSEKIESQEKYVEKFNNYVEKWYNAFENQNLDKMSSYQEKISNLYDKMMPFKDIKNEYDNINTIQEIVKENGFVAIGENELELIKALNN